MNSMSSEKNGSACVVVTSSCCTPLSASEFSEGFVSVDIQKFPFKIGRDSYGDISYGLDASKNDFSIADGEPFQVSRKHCLIECESGNLYVRDSGSSLGTIVNGTQIGVRYASLTEPLKPGTNSLILGTARSPYKFQIEVA